MAKTWRLDSETKGTGAHVAPFERAPAKPRDEPELSLVTFTRPAPEAEMAQAPAPLEFKVVDVMSANLLAEGIDARATVALLEEVRSVLDVRMFVWIADPGRWRLLSLDEQKAMWRFRGQASDAAA
jgi:hypothetical protein